MYSQLIKIFIVGYIISFGGSQDNDPKKCFSNGQSNCLEYTCTICIKDNDNHVYPGKLKTVAYHLFVPPGLTTNASIYFKTFTDMSVIISDVKLAFQDNNFTMTNGSFKPFMTKRSDKRVSMSTEAVYHFGDIECKQTPEFVTESTDSIPTPSVGEVANFTSLKADPCPYCLVKLAAKFLMANISDVFENSTRNVSATLMSDNVTLGTGAMLVMRPIHISPKKFDFSLDILDLEELPLSSTKAFKLQAMFQSPLSTYKLVLHSQNRTLQIASFRLSFVGEHFKDIIPRPTGPDPDDGLFCSGITSKRMIFFDYLPNKGAYDDNAPAIDDMVEFEVMLLMTEEAIPGEIHFFNIDMEVDHVRVMDLTKYFNATAMNPIAKINITTSQNTRQLPKSATGSVTITFGVPLLSSGEYSIHTSTKLTSGPGGNGLIVGGMEIDDIGSNIPCIDKATHWKRSRPGIMKISNLPYTSKPMSSANKISLTVSVVAISELVETFSTHELSATVSYPGDGSPQSFKFYFGIIDTEYFTSPDIHGNLPLGIHLYETCRSITPSTELVLNIHTSWDSRYGRLLVELPMPADLMGQSFILCYFGIVNVGYNIFARFNTTTERRDDDLIEKVLVDISPLTNIYFVTFNEYSDDVTMRMVATFINNSLNINNIPNNFTASVISNNVTIWTGIVPITHPSIYNLLLPDLPIKDTLYVILVESSITARLHEYYPNFVVVTGIVKLAYTNPANILYHYSQNGTNYHQESIKWDRDTHGFKFEFPKVVSHFYFTTDACTVICHVRAAWMPLRDYVTIVQDNNDTMLKMLPYALDQDSDTCFDLPVPGDSPSMLWMITNLSLFGVTSQRFVVHITGHDIECGNIGQKSIHVGTSGPAYNHQCSIESDVLFCKSLLRTDNASMTQCDIECKCDTLVQCSNVHIFMQSTNTDVWSLCELTISDVVDI